MDVGENREFHKVVITNYLSRRMVVNVRAFDTDGGRRIGKNSITSMRRMKPSRACPALRKSGRPVLTPASFPRM